jgi:hypothetical protein
MGPILEPLQPTSPVAVDPGVHRLAADPVAVGDLGHRQPRLQHLPHRVVALLGHAALPQHPLGLLPTATNTAHKQTERRCQASAETPVKHQPQPTCQPSPATTHACSLPLVTTSSTIPQGRPCGNRDTGSLNLRRGISTPTWHEEIVGRRTECNRYIIWISVTAVRNGYEERALCGH